MTASDVSSWAQTGILFLTLIATTVISVINLRKANAAEKRAQADSDIIANGLDAIAQSLKTLDLNGLAPHLGVRWAITWERGSTYRIENVGDERAANVVVTTHETLPTRGLDGLPMEKLDPTESFEFVAIRTMGTTDANITIAWQGEDGQDYSWKRALPFSAQ